MVHAKWIYHKIYARFKPRFKARGCLNRMPLNHLCEIYHWIYAGFKSMAKAFVCHDSA